MSRQNIIYLSLAVVAVGYYYVKVHTMLLSDNALYYGYYDQLNGLQVSNPLAVNGAKVGYVKNIILQPYSKVKVEFAIDKKLELKEGTVAAITTGDFVGSKTVAIKPGSGAGVIPHGGTLQTAADSSFMEIYQSKYKPVVMNSLYLLRSADSTLQGFNYIVVSGWGTRTREEVASFREVTASITNASRNARLRMNGVDSAVDKAYALSHDAASKTGELNSKLSKAEQKTAALKESDAGKGISALRQSVNGLSASLQNTSNQSLVVDKARYNNLKQSVDSLRASIKSLQQAAGKQTTQE